MAPSLLLELEWMPASAPRIEEETTMARYVKIGEAKTHLSALLAEVEAGEELVLCRGAKPIARVTPFGSREHAALRETLLRERAKQRAVTTSEILAWRHEGHTR